MGLAKAAVVFLLLAVFAIGVVAMYSTMQKDAPVDEYYSNESNSIHSTTELQKVLQGQTSSLLVPVLGVSGILVLFAGFIALSKRGKSF